jgi:hypothetical protein
MLGLGITSSYHIKGYVSNDQAYDEFQAMKLDKKR